MTAFKLTKEGKDFLRTLVKPAIPPSHAAMFKSAHDNVIKVVSTYLAKAYPAKDMKVLAKYGKACSPTTVSVNNETRRGVTVNLDHLSVYNPDDRHPYHDHEFTIPLDHKPLPLITQGHTQIIDNAVYEAAEMYHQACDATGKAVWQRQKDYLQFIKAAKTLEEIETIWPEAKQLRKQESQEPQEVI